LGVAALNTYRRFVVSSFAPGLLNVAFIAAAFALPAWFQARGHDPLLALAVGVLVGGVLQVIAQWPSLASIGYLGRPSLELRHPGVQQALRRMIPVLFGIGIYYIDVLLARRFLSELGVGAQSYFNFALRLCDFPQGIFVMALQTATLPSLSLLAARGEREELTKTFAYGMRMALFVALPATVLFVGLAHPLVVLVFQRGEFDSTASDETAKALMAQGLGIWTVAAVRQLVSVYYAVGDTRTPVIVSALDLAVFVTAALVLRGPLGHVGVSLAVTLSGAAQALMLWLMLRRHLSHLALVEVGRSVARTLVALIPAWGSAWAAAQLLAPWLSGGAFARLLPGLAATAVFGFVFLGAAWLVRSEELHAVVGPIKRRLARSR
jgi:putative peptidoglycan lipid II flippase